MKIEKLTENNIDEATQGGNDALKKVVQTLLKHAPMFDRVIYIRYAPGFLQWTEVLKMDEDKPEVQERLNTHAWWDIRRIGISGARW